jgi:hypothetical protein
MKHNFRLYAIGLTALSMVFFAGCKDKEPESLTGTVSGTENPEVSLRYYSSILKNTFVSVQTFPFRNDENIGTVSNPYSPEFVVLKAK